MVTNNSEDLNIMCTICLDTLMSPYVALTCGHIYHKNCIINWKVVCIECPICPSEISDANFLEVFRKINSNSKLKTFNFNKC